MNFEGTLRCKLGGDSEKDKEYYEEIRVSYDKTIKTADFETEKVHNESTVVVNWRISGIERMIISQILSNQLQFSTLMQLVYQGKVTKTYFDSTNKANEMALSMLIDKAKSVIPDFDIEKYVHLV